MDKQKADEYCNSVPVVIKRYGKENLYGGVVGINADCLNNATAILVLENLKNQKFNMTQDKGLFTSVPYEDIEDIYPQK